MVKVAIVNLNEEKNWNKWVIGTPPAIPDGSSFYSGQIQISHIKNPSKKLKNEEKHYHKSPIEEYYLVLMGTLEVEVNDEIVALKANELLAVPPNVYHKVCNYSDDVAFLAIRAPVSTDETKVTVKDQ